MTLLLAMPPTNCIWSARVTGMTYQMPGRKVMSE